MIKVEEALKIIIESHPGQSIISCYETEKYFAFAMIDKGYELVSAGGGYYTVNKETADIGTVSSVELFVYTEEKIPINLAEIKQRTGFEEIFVIDYTTLRYDKENEEYVKPDNPRYDSLPETEW